MAVKSFIDLTGLGHFRDRTVVTEIITSDVGYILATGKAQAGVTYYSRSGTKPNYTYTVVTGLVVGVSDVSSYYITSGATINSRYRAPSVAGVADYIDDIVDDIISPMIDAKVSSVSYDGTNKKIIYTNGGDHDVVAVDTLRSDMDEATTAAKGLMSSNDKSKLDNMVVATDVEVEDVFYTVHADLEPDVSGNMTIDTDEVAVGDNIIVSGTIV